MSEVWYSFPAGAWQQRDGLPSDGEPSERHFRASYALDPRVPPHLNGSIRATLKIDDWRTTGCAGLVFRATDHWSMNCAYIYAPVLGEDRVLLRFAEYSDGVWQRLLDSSNEIRITNNAVQFVLEYRSGQVSCILTSGDDRISLSTVITSNPFPGRVGVLRFYDCRVAVQEFQATCQDSLVELPRVMPDLTTVVTASPPAECATKPLAPITILFLAANPSKQTQLNLSLEIEKLRARLLSTKHRDAYQLEQHFEVEATALQSLLLRYNPQIVHFSGHGTRDGQLIFQNQQRDASPMPTALIAKTFASLRDKVRCVILNACFSQIQAEAIVENIETVIGMDGAIADRDAIEFSAMFYEALGQGTDMKTAFELACNQISISAAMLASSATPTRDILLIDAVAGDAGATIPKLLTRFDIDPATVTFVKRI